jgi:DNA-binding transcriptional ArsR family regulator
MVKYSLIKLDRTFAALADPTRRQIVERLARGGVSISGLAASRGVTQAAILKHVGVLERAGLVTSRKVGRVRQVSLSPAPMRHLSEWLEEYRSMWEARLDRLADHLQQSQGTQP